MKIPKVGTGSKQKSYVGFLKVTEEKSRIRILSTCFYCLAARLYVYFSFGNYFSVTNRNIGMFHASDPSIKPQLYIIYHFYTVAEA